MKKQELDGKFDLSQILHSELAKHKEKLQLELNAKEDEFNQDKTVFQQDLLEIQSIVSQIHK